MGDEKYRILCVDDDPDILESLRIVLESGGYQVSTAQSGEEGLARYKEWLPDLVIIDLMMEEIDSGTNLVKELKILGNRAPVYLLSSTGDNLQNAIDFSELGLTGVFQKPVNPTVLLKIIEVKLRK